MHDRGRGRPRFIWNLESGIRNGCCHKRPRGRSCGSRRPACGSRFTRPTLSPTPASWDAARAASGFDRPDIILSASHLHVSTPREHVSRRLKNDARKFFRLESKSARKYDLGDVHAAIQHCFYLLVVATRSGFRGMRRRDCWRRWRGPGQQDPSGPWARGLLGC